MINFNILVLGSRSYVSSRWWRTNLEDVLSYNRLFYLRVNSHLKGFLIHKHEHVIDKAEIYGVNFQNEKWVFLDMSLANLY